MCVYAYLYTYIAAWDLGGIPAIPTSPLGSSTGRASEGQAQGLVLGLWHGHGQSIGKGWAIKISCPLKQYGIYDRYYRIFNKNIPRKVQKSKSGENLQFVLRSQSRSEFNPIQQIGSKLI